MWSPMKKYRELPPFKKGVVAAVAGVAALGLFVALLGVFLIATGGIMVSARPPHNPSTTFVLHNAFKNSVASEAKSVDMVAGEPFPGQMLLGAQHYEQVCSSCHGAPGLGQSPQALSMRPRPQYLPAVVSEFSDAELYVIVRDGVRFSAMPSWPADSNFSEIWPMVRFLRELPDLTVDEYREMVSTPLSDPGATPSIPWDSRGAQQNLKIHAMAPPLKEYGYFSPSIGWRPYGFQDRPLNSCVACHGPDGTGSVTGGNAPNLTLLSEQQIARHLRNYANGSRPSGYMAIAASMLSGPQIDALAKHFSQAGPQSSNLSVVADRGAVGAAQKIALGGIPDKAVPACATCHGSEARRMVTGAPNIIGQNEGFLRMRLFSFGEKDAPKSGPGVWHPMPYMADNVGEARYGGLAGYFAGLALGSTIEPTLGNGAGAGLAAMRIDQKPLPQFVGDVCTACHGKKLTGSPEGEIPNITLQSPVYLSQQLLSFRLRHRQSSKMQDVTGELTTDNILAIARYIGSLSPAPSSAANGAKQSAAMQSAAARLATQGDRSRRLPACLSCHSREGVGTVELIPPLDGQNPLYLSNRLDRWADEHSGDERKLGPMPGIAGKLTSEERKALAEYFAKRPRQPKQ